MTLAKSGLSFKSPRSNTPHDFELTYGRINTLAGLPAVTGVLNIKDDEKNIVAIKPSYEQIKHTNGVIELHERTGQDRFEILLNRLQSYFMPEDARLIDFRNIKAGDRFVISKENRGIRPDAFAPEVEPELLIEAPEREVIFQIEGDKLVPPRCDTDVFGKLIECNLLDDFASSITSNESSKQILIWNLKRISYSRYDADIIKNIEQASQMTFKALIEDAARFLKKGSFFKDGRDTGAAGRDKGIEQSKIRGLFRAAAPFFDYFEPEEIDAAETESEEEFKAVIDNTITLYEGACISRKRKANREKQRRCRERKANRAASPFDKLRAGSPA